MDHLIRFAVYQQPAEHADALFSYWPRIIPGRQHLSVNHDTQSPLGRNQTGSPGGMYFELAIGITPANGSLT